MYYQIFCESRNIKYLSTIEYDEDYNKFKRIEYHSNNECLSNQLSCEIELENYCDYNKSNMCFSNYCTNNKYRSPVLLDKIVYMFSEILYIVLISDNTLCLIRNIYDLGSLKKKYF